MSKGKGRSISTRDNRIIDAEFSETESGPLRLFGHLLYMAACGAGFTVIVFGLSIWLLSSIEIEIDYRMPCTMVEDVPLGTWPHDKPCDPDL